MTWIPKACPKPKSEPKRVKMGGCSKRSTKSGGHLFYGEKYVSTARRNFIKRQACAATGAKSGELIYWREWMPEGWKGFSPWRAKVVPAHVRARGAGNPDRADMIPLDWKIHDWLGQIGKSSFERRVHLMDLQEIAELYETKFLARKAATEKNVKRTGAA